MVLSAAEISDVFAREDQAFKVTHAGQVPPSYDSISDDWLTDVLCGQVPGAKVVAHRFDARDDGSANRRRIFITYNEAGTAAGLPARVFSKAAETLENRIVLGVSGAGKAETDFFARVRPLLDIETPVCLYAGYDPANEASLTMMPDLADTVTFCNESTPVDFQRATSQIALLANLHARFYESPDLGTDAVPFRTWDRWWADMMEGDPDFERYCDIAFTDGRDLMPERLYQRRSEIWPATQKSAARHAELPHSLIHCDVHLKNWYVAANGAMGITDWQCVNIGHWSRDFIYTITSALTVEDRRKWEGRLLTAYLDRMETLGVPRISEDEAWVYLSQQLMTVLAFWNITLRPSPGMPPMQPEHTTRTFLRRIYAAIDDHSSLDSFG